MMNTYPRESSLAAIYIWKTCRDSPMPKTKFRLNIAGPVVIAFLWLIVLFVVSQIFSGLSIRSLPGGGLPPQAGLLIIILVLFYILAGGIPTWAVIREWSTVLDKQEIKQISLHGYKKIQWRDVIKVEDVGTVLYIKSNTVWITMNLALYKNPPEVVDFVNRMVNIHQDSKSE
jgi:hypothetical protein